MTQYTEKDMTPFFPADVKPTHVGVYIVDDEDGMDGTWFANWNGVRFGYREESAYDAYASRDQRTDCGDLTKWRGLSFDPSKEAK